uniref:Uncharacterized protein n=1 Tax=viral metagenome TaxID=1070528 RepID=A0A6C0HJH2_9ZZZZ
MNDYKNNMNDYENSTNDYKNNMNDYKNNMNDYKNNMNDYTCHHSLYKKLYFASLHEYIFREKIVEIFVE